MHSWELAARLDSAADLPIFLQIARAISADVRRDRLHAGDALPSSHTLACSLAVHRNRVLAAYRELTAEGWIEATLTRGTVVSSAVGIPVRPSRAPRVAPAATMGFDLGPAIDPYPVASYAAGWSSRAPGGSR